MNEGRVYLVTGGSGFIGRALCRRLRKSGRVRALHRRDAQGPWDEAVLADLASPCALEAALDGVDTVFHLAGRTDDSIAGLGDAAAFRSVNFEGTRRLFEAASGAGVRRFVYASSVKAMGAAAESPDEDSPEVPTPYGRSKRDAEAFILANTGVPHVSVVRPSPVYGPGSKGNLARMIRGVARGTFPPLPDTGNARSMVHVEDLVSALLLCAARDEANRRAFVVTDGRAYSTREIYEWICESLGRRPPRWSVPPWVFRGAGALGDVWIRLTGRSAPLCGAAVDRLLGSARYDSTLIEKTLGFRPARDLRSALPDMVRAARK